MKIKIFFTLALSTILSASYSQQSNIWSKWSWLIGEWVGEGSGQPGQGGGTFSFRPDLDKKILVRKSHSEYPAAENKPKVIHDDLMIIYPDQYGNVAKAIYFDNEGHTINYTITCSGKSIIMTSDKISNVPVFRLTYDLLENDIVNTKFEMSQDGIKFIVYIEGKSMRSN
jgi:hypothetical protein